MQLKVISKDSVKVLIEEKDIGDICPAMDMITPDVDKSGTFIVNLLEQIKEKTGVDFLDSKVIIDILPGINNSYYLIISRINQNFSKNELSGEDVYLFELNGIENLMDVISLIDSCETVKVNEMRVYKYRNRYYLSLSFGPSAVENDHFPDFLKRLRGFCVKCRWSLYNEPILNEWGELLFKKGAVE